MGQASLFTRSCFSSEQGYVQGHPLNSIALEAQKSGRGQLQILGEFDEREPPYDDRVAKESACDQWFSVQGQL